MKIKKFFDKNKKNNRAVSLSEEELKERALKNKVCRNGNLVFFLLMLIELVGGMILQVSFLIMETIVVIMMGIFVMCMLKMRGDEELMKNRTIYITTGVVKFVMMFAFIGEGFLWKHDNIENAGNGAVYILSVFILIMHLIETSAFKKNYKSFKYRRFTMIFYLFSYGCMVLGNNSFWGLIMLIPILTAFAQCEDVNLIKRGCIIANLIVIAGGLTQTQYYDTKVYASIADIPKLFVKIFKGTLKDESTYMLYIYIFIVSFLILYSYAIENVIKHTKSFNEEKMDVIKNEQGRIERLIEKVVEIGMKIKASAYETNIVVNDLETSISKTGKKLATISKDTNTNKNRISTQTKMTAKISGLIANVVDETREVSKGAEKSLNELERNKEYFRDLKDNSDKINDNNKMVNIVIDEFVQNARQVKDITEGIGYILDETHLLSFNTSIKSAKAGEMGKSFAVIAKEIRNLADETTVLTEKINAIVAKLEDSALVTQNVIKEVVGAINEEKETIDSTMEEFERMNANIHSLSGNVGEISNRVDSVTEYNNEIEMNVDKLDDSTSFVVVATNNVKQVNNDNEDRINNTRKLMGSMLKMADDLEELYYMKDNAL